MAGPLVDIRVTRHIYEEPRWMLTPEARKMRKLRLRTYHSCEGPL